MRFYAMEVRVPRQLIEIDVHTLSYLVQVSVGTSYPSLKESLIST